MNRIIRIAAAAIFLLSAPSWAADKDTFLDHLSGSWLLTGTIANQETTHDVTAEWIVQNTYLRLTEVSRELDKAGKPQYEAEVILGYDKAKQRYVCFWFDNTGVAGPSSGGVAKRQGDMLPFAFKSPDNDFRNTFAYDAKADTWTWHMDLQEGGRKLPFARVTLVRP
jgi:hypothetical protein